jgi:hypothetical protein
MVLMIFYSPELFEILKLALYFLIHINRMTLFKAFFLGQVFRVTHSVRETVNYSQQAITMFPGTNHQQEQPGWHIGFVSFLPHYNSFYSFKVKMKRI